MKAVQQTEKCTYEDTSKQAECHYKKIQTASISAPPRARRSGNSRMLGDSGISCAVAHTRLHAAVRQQLLYTVRLQFINNMRRARQSRGACVFISHSSKACSHTVTCLYSLPSSVLNVKVRFSYMIYPRSLPSLGRLTEPGLRCR